MPAYRGFSGGRRLKRFIRSTSRRSGPTKNPTNVAVGFFATSRYPPVRTGKNGGGKQIPHPVAYVAAINEFGSKEQNIPERPFFRQAIAEVKPKLRNVLRNDVKPIKGGIDKRVAGKLGLIFANEIKESITRLATPPNAPSTKKRKAGSTTARTNPLIDTGFMRNSVTWRVDFKE